MSFIESCNVCIKHDRDSKPHSLTPATIFVTEFRKTKKTLKILYSSKTLCNSSLILAPVCAQKNGTTLSTVLYCSKSLESQWLVKLRKEALFVTAVQMSVVKELLLISSRDNWIFVFTFENILGIIFSVKYIWKNTVIWTKFCNKSYKSNIRCFWIWLNISSNHFSYQIINLLWPVVINILNFLFGQYWSFISLVFRWRFIVATTCFMECLSLNAHCASISHLQLLLLLDEPF